MKNHQANNEEAEIIVEKYPVEVNTIRLVSERGGRAQWLVETDQGRMILKRELRKPEKMLFIAGAHKHLQENGFPVTNLIETSEGELFVGGEDRSYVMYEKHDGSPLNYYSPDHLRKAMAFKAEFHEKSKGYSPPKGGKKRRRLGKWEKLYRWKLQQLEGFKLLAANQETDPFSELFLMHVDEIMKRGKRASEEIEQDSFKLQVQAYAEENRFCQQDFTLSRLTLKDGKAFMKELRSVNIDLPMRDLRIMLDKVMKKLSVWDVELCCEMLRAYHEVRPLTKEDLRILWTDLRFPHLFCSIAQNYYLREKKAWSDFKYLAALKNVVAIETSKSEFLDRFDEIYEKITG
ncbi:MAG TPA: CotS family spore coat protein [Bacillales bacterium]|nr:CotS family spore coat protein [Bacillales bacterium]